MTILICTHFLLSQVGICRPCRSCRLTAAWLPSQIPATAHTGQGHFCPTAPGTLKEWRAPEAKPSPKSSPSWQGSKLLAINLAVNVFSWLGFLTAHSPRCLAAFIANLFKETKILCSEQTLGVKISYFGTICVSPAELRAAFLLML